MTVLVNGLNVLNVLGHIDTVKWNEGTVGTGLSLSYSPLVPCIYGQFISISRRSSKVLACLSPRQINQPSVCSPPIEILLVFLCFPSRVHPVYHVNTLLSSSILILFPLISAYHLDYRDVCYIYMGNQSSLISIPLIEILVNGILSISLDRRDHVNTP